eukprot:scaffold2188_cov102-Isochrysis_galbana.AAC.13
MSALEAAREEGRESEPYSALESGRGSLPRMAHWSSAATASSVYSISVREWTTSRCGQAARSPSRMYWATRACAAHNVRGGGRGSVSQGRRPAARCLSGRSGEWGHLAWADEVGEAGGGRRGEAGKGSGKAWARVMRHRADMWEGRRDMRLRVGDACSSFRPPEGEELPERPPGVDGDGALVFLHQEIGGAEAERPNQRAVGELAEAREGTEQLVLEAQESLGHHGGTGRWHDERGNRVDLAVGGRGRRMGWGGRAARPLGSDGVSAEGAAWLRCGGERADAAADVCATMFGSGVKGRV